MRIQPSRAALSAGNSPPASMPSVATGGHHAGIRGWDPFLISLSVFVVVSIGRVHQLVPALAVIKPAVLSGAAMLAFFFVLRRPTVGWSRLDRTWRFLVTGIAVWTALTIPLSIYAGLSFNWWKDVVLQSCGLAIIVAIGVRNYDDARKLIAVFVLATAFYSIMILRTFGADLNVRFEGLYSYDTNDFAQVVVCALPFSIFLALSARQSLARVLYWSTVLLFLIIVMKSGSRGGFLGLVVVGVLALTTWRAVSARLRVTALVTAVAFMALFGSEMFLARVNSILHPADDYNVTSESGRLKAWKRGLRYMIENPILGVGVGAFGVAEGTLSELAVQARQRGRGVRWMAPHNSFVEIGAEAGVPGLVLFSGLCLLLLRQSFRAARARGPDRRPRLQALMAGALFLSIAGFYVTAFFLSQSYSAHLFLLAGLVGALTKTGFESF